MNLNNIYYKRVLEYFLLLLIVIAILQGFYYGIWKGENVTINAIGIIMCLCTLAIVDAIERKR